MLDEFQQALAEGKPVTFESDSYRASLICRALVRTQSQEKNRINGLCGCTNFIDSSRYPLCLQQAGSWNRSGSATMKSVNTTTLLVTTAVMYFRQNKTTSNAVGQLPRVMPQEVLLGILPGLSIGPHYCVH